MLNVGLIGCGHISETYFRSQTYFNNIDIVACADINIEAANKCAQEYNIQAKDVDDLLVDNRNRYYFKSNKSYISLRNY